jgi:hypothetical protein
VKGHSQLSFPPKSQYNSTMKSGMILPWRKKAIEFQAFLGFGVPSILEHVEARKALSCLGVVPVISVRSAD